ncbi:MAG: deoxyribonuclease IV, partial [Candidatus Rokuibacteriota bacterium]
ATRLLVELMAGTSGAVASTIEEARRLFDAVGDERLGLVLDTCHLFAAGQDVRTPAGLAAALARFDRAVGLDRVLAVHLNDARAGLGSGLDRHEHIGRGGIGLRAFRLLVTDPRLRAVPMVLETPKEGDWDRRNLATLRGLRRPSRRPARQREASRNRSAQRRVAST